MSKFLKWLDNFWYHYKWRVIIITFFAVVFIVCATQCVMKTDADVAILYVGPQVVSAEGYDEMETVLEKCLDEDYNGDDEVAVRITDVVLLSDEQLAEKKAEAEKDNDYLYYNTASRQEAFNQAKNWMVSGEMILCILDPYVYGLFEGQDLFMPLAEYLDEVPDYAYDAYALPFDEIPYVDFYEALHPIADGALLCMVKPTWFANMSSDDVVERYEPYYALIENMLTFSVE